MAMKRNLPECIFHPSEVLMQTLELLSEKTDMSGPSGSEANDCIPPAGNVSKDIDTEKLNVDAVAEEHAAECNSQCSKVKGRELDNGNTSHHDDPNSLAAALKDDASPVCSRSDITSNTAEKSVLCQPVPKEEEVAVSPEKNDTPSVPETLNSETPVSGCGMEKTCPLSLNLQTDTATDEVATLSSIKLEPGHRTDRKASSDSVDFLLPVGEIKSTTPVMQSQHDVGSLSEEKLLIDNNPSDASGENDTDSIKSKFGSAVKFAWPAQTVNMGLHNTVPPTTKGKGGITTQTFVLKKVGKNSKLAKVPGANYKIRPVFGAKPKRQCPVVYVGVPFMSNPDDLPYKDEKSDSLPVSLPSDVPNIRAPSSDKPLEICKTQNHSFSQATCDVAAGNDDVYDLTRMRDAFAPPETATTTSGVFGAGTSITTSNTSDVAPELHVGPIKNLFYHGSSMVLPRPRLGKDEDLVDMAAPVKVRPPLRQVPPTTYVVTPSNLTGLPVTEYRIISAKEHGALPRLIKTPSSVKSDRIQHQWQHFLPKQKLVVTTPQKPVLMKSPGTQPGISGALIVDSRASPIVKAAGPLQASQRPAAPKAVASNLLTTQQKPSIIGTPAAVQITPAAGVQTPSPLIVPKPDATKASNSLISVDLSTTPAQIKRVCAIAKPTVSASSTICSAPKKVIQLSGFTHIKVPHSTGPLVKSSVPSSTANANTAALKQSISTTHVPIPQPAKTEIRDKDVCFAVVPLRSGVEVKFADGVRHHITKLSDLMYQDDEPIKSWSALEKGTKVAALWTDGLMYDATVTRSSHAAKAKEVKSQKDQLQPVVKLEKLKPGETKTNNRKHEQPKKEIPTQIMCSLCRIVFSKVLAFRKHQKEKCKSPGITHIAHADTEKLCHATSETATQVLTNIPKKSDDTSSNTANQKCPSASRRGRKRKQRPSVEEESKRLKTDDEDCKIMNNTTKETVTDNKNWTPPLINGKAVFCNGTKFLHRWQLPDGGSKWYHGKITKIISPNEGRDCEFAVTYKGEEDQGPYIVKLYEDYPTDIRLIKF